MRTLTYVSLVGALVILTPLSLAAAALPGGGTPCVVSYIPGASYLTITPPGCVYQGSGHSLPPNIPFTVRLQHLGFVNVQVFPGGSLGGHLETFGSDVLVQVGDSGPVVKVPAQVAVSSEPFEDGAPFVSFATSMDRLEGEISGDPVFDYFSIRAGTELVGDSPGQTTITSDPDTETATVNSIFHIQYHIEFQGAAGGPLEGYAGVSDGTATMEAFGQK